MNSKNKDIDNKKTLSQMADELIGDFRQLDTCTEEEITSSWQSVVSRTRHKRNLTYWYSGIAACLLIGFLTFLHYTRTLTNEEPTKLSLLRQACPAMQTPGNICLQSNGKDKFLPGNARVDFRTSGQIIVNDTIVLPVTPGQNQLIVPKGKRGLLWLADGSRVDINAGSRVIFPHVFNGRNREIALEGEACLDISKDHTHPFITHTPDFRVKVFGTLFNVSTSGTSTCGEVTLAEGAVELQTQKGKMKLSPGEQALLEGTTMRKQKVDVYPFLCWKEGILLLNNRKIPEIAAQLSEYFGQSVYCDPAIQNLELGGKLSLQNDLATTLNILCNVSGLRMETQGNSYRLSLK